MRISQVARKNTGITLAFLTTAFGLFGCTQVGQLQILGQEQYSIEQDTVVIYLDRVPGLSEVGGSVIIECEDIPFPIIIARTGDCEYAVASNSCTHKGKPLSYDHKKRLFRCTCGRGRFNIDGSVAGGPPEKPLKIYSYTVNNGRLVINYAGI